ncbi:peptidyl-prolyl cis-trans isomerase FKBP8 [Rhagoletis pomonella]|uniref:peptidyl-prolyl cis-trans isomerase FKBP8 n=1 Tax=Rhagoletis pomonella TaxID=28610 RepID=UPI001784A226|nr:peptidyl-prolyl cis-trans isomerase FKBP8 [Rhagoletis pomonella]XP_036332749.1 peptidyl-prolyl cis-trans isomerase FKBP8 [Rhagoletis pomonella]XP_036332750.1 peptidyl-prolyl cis-trans isomerase FKBP8 [Rhagoletis pomonella]XP_036332751.1 peptidyl-prolyl cis-trans isomerase FKBP8 [Rhagoletis pomonella]
MDTEKSSNSSFEDLSNINEAESKPTVAEADKKTDLKEEDENNHKEPNIQKNPKDEGHESASARDDESCDVLGNGQLVKRVLKQSTTGKRPTRGDLVTVSFTGKLPDGTVVEQKKNFQMHVGDFEVVQGLDMAIPLMSVGEVAEIRIDTRFAYGSLGFKNENNESASVPADANLIYEVHLLDSKGEDFSDLKSYEVRRKYGTSKKERANFWYNRNEFNTAIQLYRRALEYLDDRDGDPDSAFDKEDLELSNSDLQTLLEDRLIVYNNLAMAQIKISAFDAALKSVENVLRCQPNNSKALYRKGRILEGKGDTKGAISLLQKAATLEPDSKAIQQDLAKLIIKARREEHNEKEMYQKMLGQAKKLEQKHKQPQKQQNIESSKLKLIGYLMGSILIGVAGVAIYRYKY